MNKPAAPTAQVTNFIRNIIEADLAKGTYVSRRWGGKPGPASTHANATPDPARIRTRFPPEPNGYLHFGHAKSICLNFGLALLYSGGCHMRFDDTNPVTEDTEYVASILDSVKWLGFDWGSHLYYASDYFDWLYRFAEAFIEHELAYVDSLTADEMREYRGTLTETGKHSPHRDRPVAENLDLFRRMKAGEFPDGAHVLRLKIDMSSPNINLRDPAIYRIRHAHHHRTGDKWCVYPMYDYTHCISDALENITHSICTLEFEDHRPLYDWVLERLADFGVLTKPLPHQYEFARLNLTYVVLSKRKLIQLVEEEHVDGWDDPRMPTLVAARRRGFTPEGFHLFAERIGVSKSDSWIDMSVLEDCMREVLNESAPRRIAVLDPVRLVIDNYPAGKEEICELPNHPQKPEWGKRAVPFSRELWIEREDFMDSAVQGLLPPVPGQRGAATLRLRSQVHRRRQGRRRQRHRGALRNLPRFQVGHAGRGQVQGEGQHSLGVGAACLQVRGAALRPLVRSGAPRIGTRLPCRHQSALEDRHPCLFRTVGPGREARGALPIRAPRLLHCRPQGFDGRRTSFQPDGDFARFLG